MMLLCERGHNGISIPEILEAAYPNDLEKLKAILRDAPRECTKDALLDYYKNAGVQKILKRAKQINRTLQKKLHTNRIPGEVVEILPGLETSILENPSAPVVFLVAFKEMLGPDFAREINPEVLLKNRGGYSSEIANLRGLRFVTCMETGQGLRLNEPFIKALTGGDAISARHLYHEPFEFMPQMKLFLGTNHCPTIQDDSLGMWRRVQRQGVYSSRVQGNSQEMARVPEHDRCAAPQRHHSASHRRIREVTEREGPGHHRRRPEQVATDIPALR